MKILPTFLIVFSLCLVIFVLAPAPTQAVDNQNTWFWQRRTMPSVPPQPTIPPYINSRIPIPTNNQTSSPQPTSSPTTTPKPTVTPTVTPNPTVNPTPTPTPAPNPTTSIQNYIINAINEYRRLKGLSEVKTDPYTCSFAVTRAKEITSAFNHDGFTTRVANKTVPYPGYSLITENIAMTSDYRRVVNLWINSPAHAANMQKDTPYVCVESYGNYYAYEGWRP